MTSEQIAKLLELEAKATKGPWHKGNNGYEDGDPRNPAFPGVHDASGLPHGSDFICVSLGTSEECHANSDLIAFLRNNAIPLCNALEAAQNENAELSRRLEAAREALDRIRRPVWWMQEDQRRKTGSINGIDGHAAAKLADSAPFLRGIADAALETLNQPLP